MRTTHSSNLAAAAAVSVAVILSAPFAQQAFTSIGAIWPSQLRTLALAASLVPIGGALLAAVARIRHGHLARYTALAACAALGGTYAIGADVPFAEGFHFVEYGLIAFLCYRAGRPLGRGTAIILPLAATLVVGTFDEWFQWFVPIRVGEARDVALDAVAGACGLLYGLAFDPPGRLDLSLRRVAAWTAVPVLIFAGFFATVHVGHDVRDPEIGSFRSRYTADGLADAARVRGERWREQPPLVLRRLSREDQYLTEGLWRVQRRNQASSAGDAIGAWRENRILEKFYAPILDAPSYAGASGHRWSPEQRAEADARAAARRPLSSDDYAYPMYAWPAGGLSTLLLMKLLLVPGLVGAVTLAVRRWGPALGGWLASLPVVAGPVLVFYAIEQGDAFAAQAAQATLAGLLGTVAFMVAYARTCARVRWYGSVAVGWSAFAVVIAALHSLRPTLVVGLSALVAAAALGRRALPTLAATTAPSVVPTGDLAIRLVATATLVVVLTGLAERLGSSLSGLLNAFPVLTTIVAAFTHGQRGAGAAVDFIRGYLRSVVGFAVFCVVMALTLTRLGLPMALGASLAAQLTVHGLLIWRLTRRAAAAAPYAMSP